MNKVARVAVRASSTARPVVRHSLLITIILKKKSPTLLTIIKTKIIIKVIHRAEEHQSAVDMEHATKVFVNARALGLVLIATLMVLLIIIYHNIIIFIVNIDYY